MRFVLDLEAQCVRNKQVTNVSLVQHTLNWQKYAGSSQTDRTSASSCAKGTATIQNVTVYSNFLVGPVRICPSCFTVWHCNVGHVVGGERALRLGSGPHSGPYRAGQIVKRFDRSLFGDQITLDL